MVGQDPSPPTPIGEIVALNIYLRGVINQVGRMSVPNPVIESPVNCTAILILSLRDVSCNKEPVSHMDELDVAFIVRRDKYPENASDIVITKTSGDGIDVLDEEEALIMVSITDSDTDLLPSDYWYDIILHGGGTDLPPDYNIRPALSKFRLFA